MQGLFERLFEKELAFFSLSLLLQRSELLREEKKIPEFKSLRGFHILDISPAAS